MKYKLIKDDNRFSLVNSSPFIYSNSSSKLDGTKQKNKTINTARGIIKTKILTDGEIKSITDSDLNEFSLPKDLEYIAIFLESKDLELINHNFVIKVLTQIESRNLNKSEALFEVIKSIEIYIRDKKDKETLKNIKETLNYIYGRKNNQNISYEKKEFNVYQLVK